jgi:PAS domain S-box-containing protein
MIMLLHPRDGALPDSSVNGHGHALERAMGTGDPQRVGSFRFYIDGQRWEWSENVERLHGYEPGTVTPTTELILSHKHPDDRQDVANVLDGVIEGEPFSSRHRIIDTAGRTHWVIVVGDRMLDEAGNVIGTSGFYVDFTETMQSDISEAVSKVSETRAEIEQAKGLLMAVYGISADRAFDILVWRSQETNIKVRDLARRFIVAMAGTLPAGVRAQVDHALLHIT